MRKLSLFAMLIVGGFLFSGCVFLDHPIPQISNPSEIGCADTCGTYDNGHGWIDYGMGSAGPPDYVYPHEEGEFWGAVAKMEKAQAAGCALWEMAASGGVIRDDTYWNPAGADASGCEPYSYLCGWSSYPLTSSYMLCEPEPLTGQTTLCNAGNGQCRGPIPAFMTIPGSTWYNYPPNTFQTGIRIISVDETPGTAVFEGFNNLRRRPGALCQDCGAVASTIQAPEGKVVICHIPPGNPDNAHTIIVGAPAVPAHLAHGDYEGECGGGPPTGEGLQVPDGNFTLWNGMLGVGFGTDLCRYLLTGQQPYTDDYFSCARNACGTADDAVSRLQDVLAANPAADNGLVTIGVSKLNGPAQSVTLNPPLVFKMKMNVVDGKPSFAFAMNAKQSAAIQQALRFLLENTPNGTGIDPTSLSVELTSGHVVGLSTITAATGNSYALNHTRLADALKTWETKSGQSRDLNARVAGR